MVVFHGFARGAHSTGQASTKASTNKAKDPRPGRSGTDSCPDRDNLGCGEKHEPVASRSPNAVRPSERELLLPHGD